ncbi:hypothetical protein EJ110_NYTH32320 [Nymphaea thermarum]|nr:hypothetical protein EJ110_NYTH32320 [Nymphaea thermarum]
MSNRLPTKIGLYEKLENKEGGGQEQTQEKKSGGFSVAIRKSSTALYPGGGCPEGHLAVYVGENGGQKFWFVFPVCDFNDPLFRQYGFCHPGGITIPSPVSRFESLQQGIAADKFSGRFRSRSGRGRSRKKGEFGNCWGSNDSDQTEWFRFDVCFTDPYSVV